jgi:ubiquinone/menaquinone biosynthesis C-methylase UbiE|tara:strand:+ start:2060 stop:3949 length:1890 start_codon:yes stop_codon:yes gene_type:complete
MIFQYNCPECKEKLLLLENRFHCKNCLKNYEHKNNYTIFENQNFPTINHSKLLKNLFLEIKHNTFENSVNNFLKINKNFNSQFINTQYDKSIDIIFHGIGKNFLRCLDLKSELGNKSEILSHMFKEVYSIETDDDYIELQKKRFKEKKCENVSILKCNLLKLPFPDNFFDLILCNGLLENISKFINTKNLSETQKQFILELKRVINADGCIVFGVNNKNGFKLKWEGSNESSTQISSLSTKQNFSNYVSLLQNTNLKIKSYWAAPSYNIPYYSAEIDDRIAIKGFLKNFSMFISAFRGGKRQGKIIEILLSLLKYLPYFLIKKILETFSPSFIFCCWKNENINSFENWIKKETGYENVLRMSRHGKNLFMLFNKNGKIKKVIYIKRYGYEIPDHIKLFERKFPNINDPSERIWMVDWLKGRPVNSQNNDEVMATVDWLIEFQKKMKGLKMNKNNAIIETTFIKNGLKYFKHNNIEKYHNWLNQYEEYVENNEIYLSPSHGDFWCTNILYDDQTKKINVIDWESVSEQSNPFEDFIWFLSNLMGVSSSNPVSKFRENLQGNGKVSKILELIKIKLNSYFGFKFDFLLLLRISFLKWMIIQEQIKEKDVHKTTKLEECQSLFHKQILDVLS